MLDHFAEVATCESRPLFANGKTARVVRSALLPHTVRMKDSIPKRRASNASPAERVTHLVNGDVMAVQFLLVTFPEQLAVLADGAGVGFTNHVLMLPSDEYEITLDGNACVPASQDVALTGTSIVKPMVIAFAPATAAAAAATRSAAAPAAKKKNTNA